MMRILFIANNFPPEVAPLATRLYEHAKVWIEEGVDVEVLTDVPNYPEGEIYEGYENRFMREIIDEIRVNRVPMYVAPNKGVVRRSLSYLSFMVSTVVQSFRIEKTPDVVVASSPQFLSAISGYIISRLRRKPFVLEIRDLWPESIVAVGAMERNLLIRLLTYIEEFLYAKAEHVVVVTESFRRNLISRGVDERKISVHRNGVDPEFMTEELHDDRLSDVRLNLDLHDRFVVSYIGTFGMAHGVDILLEAAARSRDDTVFMLVGTGAERDRIEKRHEAMGLENCRLVEKKPRDMVPYLLKLSDVSVVHLRDRPIFETVVPSKMFEAMSRGVPIALGVRGEAREVLKEADAGVSFEPEDPDDLLRAVRTLREDPQTYTRMSEAGRRYAYQEANRRSIAREYLDDLRKVAQPEGPGRKAGRDAAMDSTGR